MNFAYGGLFQFAGPAGIGDRQRPEVTVDEDGPDSHGEDGGGDGEEDGEVALGFHVGEFDGGDEAEEWGCHGGGEEGGGTEEGEGGDGDVEKWLEEGADDGADGGAKGEGGDEVSADGADAEGEEEKEDAQHQ